MTSADWVEPTGTCKRCRLHTDPSPFRLHTTHASNTTRPFPPTAHHHTPSHNCEVKLGRRPTPVALNLMSAEHLCILVHGRPPLGAHGRPPPTIICVSCFLGAPIASVKPRRVVTFSLSLAFHAVVPPPPLPYSVSPPSYMLSAPYSHSHTPIPSPTPPSLLPPPLLPLPFSLAMTN